jgi:hypothetical protein
LSSIGRAYSSRGPFLTGLAARVRLRQRNPDERTVT